MARFKLVEGDAIALTKAYNALTAGVGTTPTPGDAAAFVAAWTHSPLAFASDSGFVALVLSSPRAAVATIAPYAEDFGAEAGELCRALLVAYELLLIQASAITPSGDSLLESTGFRFDGCCRRYHVIENGVGPVYHDTTFWSLCPEDLSPAVFKQ